MTPTPIYAEVNKIISPDDFRTLPRQENVIQSPGQEEGVVGSTFQTSTFYVEVDIGGQIGDGVVSTGDLEALAEDGGSFNFLLDPDEKTYEASDGKPI